jgi:putative transposase
MLSEARLRFATVVSWLRALECAFQVGGQSGPPAAASGTPPRARRAPAARILSIDVGEAETEAFWTDFLRGLVKRGPVGVQLAISDAHAGLKAAIAKVLGCRWQRCTVHFLRDCLGHARKDQHGLLGALIRPIFKADSQAAARDRLSEAVAHLDGRIGKVATMLEEAEHDVLAFYAFPAGYWRKLRSTDPPERFNREIGRRTDGVGIFPDDPSLVRLAGMLCIEQNDEWIVGRGYLSAESISLVLTAPDDHIDKETKEEVPELQAA